MTDIHNSIFSLGLRGKKKGGGVVGGTPQEAPNSLKSRQVARVIDVLSEGEIEGLQGGAKGIYFDDTPCMNVDNTFNFRGITYGVKTGEPDQTALAEWRGAETTVSVGAAATISQGPVTRTINDTDCDSVDVQVRIPALTQQDTHTGNLNGYRVSIRLQVAYGDPVGSYQTVEEATITGKCVAPYIKTYHIDLRAINATGPYHIKLIRVSADDATSDRTSQTYFDSYVKITEAKIKYNDTALIGLKADAKQFGSRIPVRAYDIKGIKVKLPNNYSATSRVYTGSWSGTFSAPAYSNNPAWCLYDLITAKRYGLGDFIAEANLDKFAFYEVAKYCDGLVSTGYAAITYANGLYSASGTTPLTVNYPAHGLEVGDGVYITGAVTQNGVAAASLNGIAHPVTSVTNVNAVVIDPGDSATATGGFGGANLKFQRYEPRFTMNVPITSRAEAFSVLQTVASIFHGMIYMTAGSIVPTVDKDVDPIKVINPANVEEGVFTYSGTNLKSRHSCVLVRWNNPTNDYRQAIETYEDLTLREQFGFRTLETAAFGCTSRGQARRHGRWVLETEKLGEQVTFTAGADQQDLNPGDIISISDPVYSSTRWGGRMGAALNGTRTQVTLDDQITSEFETGSYTYTLVLVMSDGSIEERTVSSVATVGGKTVVTTAAFSATGAEVGAMWLVYGEAEERLWRVLNVSQKEEKFEVTGIRHDPAKYATVDDIGVLYNDNDEVYTGIPNIVQMVTGNIDELTATEYNYVIAGVTFSRVIVSWEDDRDPFVSGYSVIWTGPQINASADPSAGLAADYQHGITATNSYEINDIQPGYYNIRVQAISDARNVSNLSGNILNVEVKGKLLPPAAPTGLTALPGNGYADLTWSFATPGDADLRHVEVWRSANTSPNALANATKIAEVSGNTFHDRGLGASGSVKYYWVRAMDLDGNASTTYYPNSLVDSVLTTNTAGLSVTSSTTPYPSTETVAGAPSNPSSVTATAGYGLVQLNWTVATETDLAGTQIYRHTSDASGSATLIAVVGAYGNTFTDYPGYGVERFYWLRSVDYSGTTSSSLVASNPTSVTTTGGVNDAASEVTPAVPISVAATPHLGGIFISWQSSATGTIAHTEIYRDTDNAFAGSALIATVEGTENSANMTYLDGVGYNKTRYYWLRHTTPSGTAGEYKPLTNAAGVSATSGTAADTQEDDDNNPAPAPHTSLTATGFYKGIGLAFNRTIMAHVKGTEIWRGTAANGSNRAKVAEAPPGSTHFSDQHLPASTTFYYWIRTLNYRATPLYSAYYPADSGGNPGTGVGATTSPEITMSSSGALSTGGQVGLPTSSSGDTLPTASGLIIGSTFYKTDTQILYIATAANVWTASANSLVVGTGAGDALAGNTSLFDGAYSNLSGTPSIPTHTSSTSDPTGTAVAGSSHYKTGVVPPELWIYGTSWVHQALNTNDTYTAGSFAITALDGYTAALYANANVAVPTHTYSTSDPTGSATVGSSHYKTGVVPPELWMYGANGWVHQAVNTNDTYSANQVIDWSESNTLNINTGNYTNSQYTAASFAITDLDGYTAALYANANVGLPTSGYGGTLPTASGLVVGSTFYKTDTKVLYIATAATTWTASANSINIGTGAGDALAGNTTILTLGTGAGNALAGNTSLFDGAYGSLSGTPSLFDGAYGSLSGLPTLFDGAYGSLSGTPTIPSGNQIIDWSQNHASLNINTGNYTNNTYDSTDFIPAIGSPTTGHFVKWSGSAWVASIDNNTEYGANQVIDWSASNALNINTANYTNTTYVAATSSAAGLMPAADFTKLAGVDTGATVNSNFTYSASTPSNPVDGDFFYDTASNKLFIYEE